MNLSEIFFRTNWASDVLWYIIIFADMVTRYTQNLTILVEDFNIFIWVFEILECFDLHKRMLSSVHLVGDDEDDIYGGFNDYNPAFDVQVYYKISK